MEFVTFEIAKKLKEKGFNCELPFAMYNEVCQFCLLTTSAPYHVCESGYKYREYYDYNDFDKNDFIAPTISHVLKWLREKKDIDLVISPVFFYDDVLGRMRDYGCKVFAPSLNKPEHCGYHEKWKQAALAGIDYVLDNLI
jgi:hypothetical protein